RNLEQERRGEERREERRGEERRGERGEERRGERRGEEEERRGGEERRGEERRGEERRGEETMTQGTAVWTSTELTATPEDPGIIGRTSTGIEQSLFLQEPSLAQKKPELIGEKSLLLKVLKRKCQEPQWTRPFRVVICTHTAVQLQGKGRTWYDLSQCAKVPKGALDQEEE
ncbi:hypothetical protein D4764_11G0002630, partial [Takifugu flavidus]